MILPIAQPRRRGRRHVKVHASPEAGRAASLAALARSRPQKRGKDDPVLTPDQIEKSRQEVASEVADAVSRAMQGVGHKQLGRRLGRAMERTLHQIYAEARSPTLATLADIALATGCTIELRFVRGQHGLLHRTDERAA